MSLKSVGIALLFFGAIFSPHLNAQNFQLQSATDGVQLKQLPENIAVYDLSILDNLNAMNISAQMVADTKYTGALQHYNQEKYIKVGTLFEPDYELLNKNPPDLILVASRSAKNLKLLQKIAPTLDFTADTNDYMNDLKNRSLALAHAFDRVEITQTKLTQLEQQQAGLKNQTKGKTALMLFAVGDNFMPHAENDRFGFSYQLTGFQSVLPPATPSTASRPAAGSPEALAIQQQNMQRLKYAVANQPDYILVLDRGAVGTGQYTAQDRIHKHPILGQSQAIKNKKVIYVNADRWYITGSGLDNTADMLKEISQAMHSRQSK